MPTWIHELLSARAWIGDFSISPAMITGVGAHLRLDLKRRHVLILLIACEDQLVTDRIFAQFSQRGPCLSRGRDVLSWILEDTHHSLSSCRYISLGIGSLLSGTHDR